MYKYVANYWSPSDPVSVAFPQNVAAPGDLILNGNFSLPTTTTINFINRGFIPTVSLTSSNNLSAAIFTINGVQNGAVVNEIINGPNNNTVTTTGFFDIISSISVNLPVNGISVGTGLDGFFPLYVIPNSGASTFSLSSTFSPYALSFRTYAGITYEIYQTLGDLVNNGETYQSLIASGFLFQKGSPYVNIDQILQFTDIANNVLVKLTATDDTSILGTNFLQL